MKLKYFQNKQDMNHYCSLLKGKGVIFVDIPTNRVGVLGFESKEFKDFNNFPKNKSGYFSNQVQYWECEDDFLKYLSELTGIHVKNASVDHFRDKWTVNLNPIDYEYFANLRII